MGLPRSVTVTVFCLAFFLLFFAGGAMRITPSVRE
jgi:hypothetical protein